MFDATKAQMKQDMKLARMHERTTRMKERTARKRVRRDNLQNKYNFQKSMAKTKAVQSIARSAATAVTGTAASIADASKAKSRSMENIAKLIGQYNVDEGKDDKDKTTDTPDNPVTKWR